MLYALVVNDIIEVGPRSWHYMMFKDHLEDENLDTTNLPRKASNEPILTDTWKLLPVIEPTPIDLDLPYEQHAGPFWTINANNVITGVWDKAPVPLHMSKSKLKETITNNRYIVEVMGTKITLNDQSYSLDTSREGRKVYTETYTAMNDTDTVNWKFPEGWATLSKADFQNIITTINTYVQNAFEWEKQKLDEIESKTTVEELKTVVLTNPNQPEPFNFLNVS